MLTVHNYKIFTKVTTLFHTHNLVVKSAELYANFMQIWTYEVFALIFLSNYRSYEVFKLTVVSGCIVF